MKYGILQLEELVKGNFYIINSPTLFNCQIYDSNKEVIIASINSGDPFLFIERQYPANPRYCYFHIGYKEVFGFCIFNKKMLETIWFESYFDC